MDIGKLNTNRPRINKGENMKQGNVKLVENWCYLQNHVSKCLLQSGKLDGFSERGVREETRVTVFLIL